MLLFWTEHCLLLQCKECYGSKMNKVDKYLDWFHMVQVFFLFGLNKNISSSAVQRHIRLTGNSWVVCELRTNTSPSWDVFYCWFLSKVVKCCWAHPFCNCNGTLLSVNFSDIKKGSSTCSFVAILALFHLIYLHNLFYLNITFKLLFIITSCVLCCQFERGCSKKAPFQYFFRNTYCSLFFYCPLDVLS